jgi:hypothetical protein
LRWLAIALCWLAPIDPIAGAAEAVDEARGGQSEQSCFYTREADNFDVLEDSNLIVYAPTKSRAFHVRIAPPANGLRFTEGIAFTGRSNRICGYAGESVVFGGRMGARRFSVVDVRRLDEAALEQLKETYTSGDGKKMPEPKPTEGADVERDLSGGGQ